ncbi:hypothetical protein [Actinoplanes sp. NPDC026619]|uniref:hypothetical protein n=1 Tax=Actinoplanes sp. NPDC026619 TaxID=3155798 RepID=UPI0033E9E228
MVLVCGPDPHDPAGLYHLGRELESDGRARFFEGRAPDGLRVALRVGLPGNGRATREFRGPPPWPPGREPAGRLVQVQVFEWADELARVVHGTDAGIEGVRRPAAALRASPPAADPELDPAFHETTTAAAAAATRPPALRDSALSRRPCATQP